MIRRADMDKKFWDGITLKGIDKWSDKLRVYWFAVSFVLLGSVADDISIWLLFIVVVNFSLSAKAVSKVKLPPEDGDNEKEEV
jgi:hypothetical protein